MARKKFKRPADVGRRGRPKLKVKKDDIVEVISGADKGRTGKVLEALPAKRKVVVQNINMRTKHLRRSQDAPQGGRLEREQPISVSNVRRVDEQE